MSDNQVWRDSEWAEQRSRHRAIQAQAFDRIGERYAAVFPVKAEQIRAGRWLSERIAPGAQVLDVGCGTGIPTARQLVDAGLRVVGIDISPAMVAAAHAEVPEADIRELDVLDITEAGLLGLDAAVAFFSLLMLPKVEIRRVLAILHAAISPGGYLLLSMVESDIDDVPLVFVGAEVRISGYLRDELRQVVAEAGFEVEAVRDFLYTLSDEGTAPEVQLYVYARR